MKKRPQIGFHRKHENEKKEKKPETKDDPWGTSFKKDNWDFGPKSTPDFKNIYEPFDTRKKK